jgi:cob(I)alamin adenosyltransferase
MNEGLDRLINLIEKSISLNTPDEIREIEQNIQIEFQKLKSDLSNQSEDNQIVNKEKLDKLTILLEKLDKKQNSQKKFLDDFSNFLKNRKIN